MAEPTPEPMGAKLPASDSWKCYRCKTVSPSPGEGRPPIACLQELGGCGRTTDWEDPSGYTRFFPADWGDGKCDLYVSADLEPGAHLFRDVQETFQAHYYLEHPWHYVVTTLFVFQAWVTDVLPVVFYLPVAGARGTGKSNFLSLIASLTNALQFENVSVPAMARTMRKGRTVTMDEMDAAMGKEEAEVRNALLRSGYKANAPAYLRWDAARKAADEIPVFGPRAFGYRGSLDDALQDRGFPIPSVKFTGKGGYDFVRRNFWPEVGDLPTRLEMWGRDARAAFPPAKLKEIVWSEAFVTKMEKAVPTLGANRDSEIGTIACLIAEMAGVDVLEALKEAAKRRDIETFAASDSDLDDLGEAILAIAGPIQAGILEDAPTVRLKQAPIRKEFDAARRKRGANRLGDSAFASLRRELIPPEWLGSHGRAVYWSVPVPFLSTLGNQAHQTHPDSIGSAGYPGEPGESRGRGVYDEDTGPVHPDPRKDAELKKLRDNGEGSP